LVVILIYLLLGSLYAVYTPAWQAPDEPAHYNYIQYLAEQHRFPVLKPGDFPVEYLEEIKSARFPPDMSIAPIRYEFHQPPLFYLLAVPVYRLFGGALYPLRLLSVMLGGVLLVIVYWAVLALAPGRSALALGAMAFVAFLPMHVAMTAATNNDTLAELLAALILLLLIRYLKIPSSFPERGEEAQLLVLLGITVGLGLVCKSPLYVMPVLVLVAIAIRHLWLDSDPPLWWQTVRAAGLFLLPAIGLALPWWLRNLTVYGRLDFLGLGRHDQVVAGQLRTAEFVARFGPAALVRDFLVTSFRSFWGQFGWMGVLLDQRLYQLLAILSALALFGFLFWAACIWRRRGEYPRWQWAAGGLVALSGLFTLGSYLWYNSQFVQHQGRYLFPALIPIALAVALGWREVLRRERALLTAGLFLVGTAALWFAGMQSPWLLLMLIVGAVAFVARRFLPPAWHPLVQAAPYLVLIVVDLASLYLFVVPQLSV
jgi:4-amino-4-deoxy-L-arabinose transferase-like glycosyltransferase